MAFVLPGGAPEFRRGDLEGTLRRVCGYERELQENLNFCLGQLSKALDRANGGVEEAAAGREAFSYDPEGDETYRQYRERYTREGERAMRDTLGQVSARTGGLASSYAGIAAQQTYDNYMAALADQIPELRQLDYQMYQDEGSRQREDLALLTALEQGDYAKYQGLLSQYNADRNFAYGQYSDGRNLDYQIYRDTVGDSRYNSEWAYQQERDTVGDRRYDSEWAYQTGRDQIADKRYEDETAYDREQDEWQKRNYASETEYDQALRKAETLAQAGDFSGYRAMGYSDSEIAGLKAAYDRDQAARVLSPPPGEAAPLPAGPRGARHPGAMGRPEISTDRIFRRGTMRACRMVSGLSSEVPGRSCRGWAQSRATST